MMTMTLGHRIVVLVITTLMAIMMVAGPVASAADADLKSDGKRGWGDGNGGGKNHPKNNKDGGDPGRP